MPLEEGQKEPLQKLTKVVNSLMSRPEAGPFLEPVDWRGLELYEYPEIVKQPMDLGTIKRKLERQQYSNAAECAADIRLVWKNCMSFNAEQSDFWLLAKQLNKRFEDRYRKIQADYYCGESASLENDADPLEDVVEAKVARDDKDGDDGDEDDDEEEEEDEEELEDDDDQEDEDDEPGSDHSPSSSKARSTSGSSNHLSALNNMDAKARFATNLLLLNGAELGFIINSLEQHCPQALQVSKTVQDRMEIMFDEIQDTSIFQKLSAYASEKAMAHKRTMATVIPINDISNKRKR
jgi:hypothetical protein